ncbi:hypothetical protein BE20_15290 [Sorangium cellulosum]|nr:hypothetical protein BE20_15290 [Sorangium cellulosum]
MGALPLEVRDVHVAVSIDGDLLDGVHADISIGTTAPEVVAVGIELGNEEGGVIRVENTPVQMEARLSGQAVVPAGEEDVAVLVDRQDDSVLVVLGPEAPGAGQRAGTEIDGSFEGAR